MYIPKPRKEAGIVSIFKSDEIEDIYVTIDQSICSILQPSYLKKKTYKNNWYSNDSAGA